MLILIILEIFTVFSYKILDIKSADSCLNKVQIARVYGDSMSPLIKNGDSVSIYRNFISCYDIKREDIVAYDYYGDKYNVIKFVKGIPGDFWEIKKIKKDYIIVVNGIVLKNSENREYQISEKKIGILSLFSKKYSLIPPDTYLLMGDDVNGSNDSTNFGLVSKKDITGIIIK